MQHDFGYITLDISKCVPSDAGVYMCKAINRAGEAVSSTSLKVKCKSGFLCFIKLYYYRDHKITPKKIDYFIAHYIYLLFLFYNDNYNKICMLEY